MNENYLEDIIEQEALDQYNEELIEHDLYGIEVEDHYFLDPNKEHERLEILEAVDKVHDTPLHHKDHYSPLNQDQLEIYDAMNKFKRET